MPAQPRRLPTFPLALLLACQGGGDATSASSSGQDPSTSTETTGSSGQVSSTSTSDEPTTVDPTTTVSSSGTGTTDESTSTSGTTGPDPTTGEETVIVARGLSHPESILYDPTADIYLISNINGDPDAADDNGFIARIHPDGTAEDLEWIHGQAADVDLDAPKGMAIFGDTLYVTDITFVRKHDRVTGEQLGSIAVDGANFLNDLSADANGNVYVSDNVVDAIHIIAPDDSVTLLFESADLSGPNGLVADDGGVYVATYGAAKLLYVPREMPVVMDLIDLPSGSLDGLARAPGGGWFVSSWDASAVFHVSEDFGGAAIVLGDVSSPADIDVDPTRDRLLVPRLLEDSAEFHPLP